MKINLDSSRITCFNVVYEDDAITVEVSYIMHEPKASALCD